MNKYANEAGYIHFREFNKDGSVNPRSGSTFAYVEVPGQNGEASRVRYAKAVCSRADNFNRKTGKAIALHRLGTDERAREFTGSVKEFVASASDKQQDLYGLKRSFTKKKKKA